MSVSHWLREAGAPLGLRRENDVTLAYRLRWMLTGDTLAVHGHLTTLAPQVLCLTYVDHD